jgi:hypothetical protein
MTAQQPNERRIQQAATLRVGVAKRYDRELFARSDRHSALDSAVRPRSLQAADVEWTRSVSIQLGSSAGGRHCHCLAGPPR